MPDKIPGTHINKPKVSLLGGDGQAYAVLAKARKALIRVKCPEEVITKYLTEAKSGDYDHLLQVTMDYVEVE